MKLKMSYKQYSFQINSPSLDIFNLTFNVADSKLWKI